MMQEISIWWPKDMGPFRPERKKFTPKPQGQVAKPQRKATARFAAKKPDRPKPAARPEKPIDPNSPFAVLGALKDKMRGN